MNIAVAQTESIPGDLFENRKKHLNLIHLAASNSVDFILFSELSLTGYEPSLAEDLALDILDDRLDRFQELSDEHNMTIAVGAPLKAKDGTQIGLAIFQPKTARMRYAKQYLYEDETAYFIPGNEYVTLKLLDEKIALSICYESKIQAHRDTAIEHGATIYLSSVAKTAKDIPETDQVLSNMAASHQIKVLMANCIGRADRYNCCGNSSVWNQQGELVERMNSNDEGVLIYDTTTDLAQIKPLN